MFMSWFIYYLHALSIFYMYQSIRGGHKIWNSRNNSLPPWKDLTSWQFLLIFPIFCSCLIFTKYLRIFRISFRRFSVRKILHCILMISCINVIIRGLFSSSCLTYILHSNDFLLRESDVSANFINCISWVICAYFSRFNFLTPNFQFISLYFYEASFGSIYIL